jgi:hypothetical protein
MVAATTAVLLSASVLWYRTHSGAIADDAVAQPSRTSPLTLNPAAFAGQAREAYQIARNDPAFPSLSFIATADVTTPRRRRGAALWRDQPGRRRRYDGHRRVDVGSAGNRIGVDQVIAMDYLMHIPLKVSSVTSNFMIGVTAGAGALVFLARGDVSTVVAAPLAIGVTIGAPGGQPYPALRRRKNGCASAT